MPTRPPTPCPKPGCLNTTPCALHPRVWGGNPNRGSSAQRGYGYAHQQWRRRVLARDQSCQLRLSGCTVKATVADHIIPRRLGGSNALSNGQGVCAHCHAIKSSLERRR